MFDPPRHHCPLCGTAGPTPVFVDERGCQVVRCRACAVEFMDPAYSDAYLEEYYSGYTRPEAEWEEPRLALQRFYLSLIQRQVKPLGRLLDVGSGQGHMLATARDAGIAVEGYEVDAKTAEQVARTRRVPVHSGDFTRIPLGTGSVDAVFVHHVLEHLKRPVEYLETIERVLRPGGVLFVAVPNVRSISITTKHTLARVGMRPPRMGRLYDTSHHLLYFSPPTLQALLERRGYELLQTRGCFRVRPGQGRFTRWFHRAVYDVPVWRSGFLCIARWPGG